MSWYHTRFEGYGGQSPDGEATPTYLADPVALDRLAATIPGARLVAVLRDPIDRAYSHYWMEHAASAIRGRSRRRSPTSSPSGRCAVVGLPRTRAVRRQLAQVCERFPRSQVHVVLLDDLRDRPHETYAATCRFLAIDDGFVPPRLGERVNRFVAFRSMRVRNLRRSLPSTLRIGRIVGRINAREGEYPPMSPEIRAQLAGHFGSDNDALAEWLGRDLSMWGAP